MADSPLPPTVPLCYSMCSMCELGDMYGYFQQDGAPCHYATAVCTFFEHEFPGHWIGCAGLLEWPSYSPDLTSLDFWLWGYLKTRVNSIQIHNLTHLEERITALSHEISSEVCKKASYCAIECFDLSIT